MLYFYAPKSGLFHFSNQNGRIMKPFVYPVLVAIMMFALCSCEYESPKYKALRAQTDSISAVNLSLTQDIGEYHHAFDYIGKSIEQITNEQVAHVLHIKTKLSEESNALINDNIDKLNTLLNTLIQSHQEEIDKLKRQVRRNAFRAAELQREVDRINILIAEECAKTDSLQGEVAAKEAEILRLDGELMALQEELLVTKAELNAQKELAEKYAEELFTGYYIAGKKSELKRKNVLAGGGNAILFPKGANKNIFTKVNILETTTIPLPDDIKGKVLSSHPQSSYKLVAGKDGKVLEILNPEKFWSVTNYLVIY